MSEILSGTVMVNGVDIWTEYGVFLVEDTRGGKDNLTALLTPSKLKDEVAVDFRENAGEKYSEELLPVNGARDVELNFALYAGSRKEWFRRYLKFVGFLKEGDKGWLTITFPQIELTMKVRYVESTKFTPLTYLWNEGVQAGKLKVKFREPEPGV